MIKSMLILLIFFALVRRGDSQDLPNSIAGGEIQLSEIESQIQKLERERETLQHQLHIRLSRADSLKSAGATENTLAHFTAASFEISQKLETDISRLKELKKQRRPIRARLYQFYSQQIDSLSRQPDALPKEQKLFVLMGKRLQVSPLAAQLHFNPRQLSAIKESNTDSLSQIIFREYLENAARALEKEIEVLKNKEREIEELAALETKAEEFMQEMDESEMLQTVSASGTKPQEVGSTDYSDGSKSARNLVTANEQAFGFFRILNQLQNNAIPLAEDAQPLSYVQLLEKLGTTRKMLEAYHRQVRAKLKRLTDK